MHDKQKPARIGGSRRFLLVNDRSQEGVSRVVQGLFVRSFGGFKSKTSPPTDDNMHGIKSTFKPKNITQTKTTNHNPYKSYKVGPEPSYKLGRDITPLVLGVRIIPVTRL